MLNHRNITTPVIQRARMHLDPSVKGFLNANQGAPAECFKHSTDAGHITYSGGKMVNRILAATPLSYNDITGLAQLFERAFHYHRQNQKQLQYTESQVFLKNIRTIVGLSFTVTLVGGDLMHLFQSYLNVFQQHQTFLNPHSKHRKLAKAFANMVSLGSDFFRCLDHPCYYESFLEALRNCITHIIDNIEISIPSKSRNIIALILYD